MKKKKEIAIKVEPCPTCGRCPTCGEPKPPPPPPVYLPLPPLYVSPQPYHGYFPWNPPVYPPFTYTTSGYADSTDGTTTTTADTNTTFTVFT